MELFSRISNKDLPRHGKTRKRGYRVVRRAHRNRGGRTIDECPQAADERSEALGEGRVSREKGRALNGLERQLGTEGFRETFKTITVDNGSEFLDNETLEQSVFSKQARTTIYYAHPNSSWERFYPLLHSERTSHNR